MASSLQSSPITRNELASNLLGRAYYLHLGLLETRLGEAGLGDLVRPGMAGVLCALFQHDDQTISSVAKTVRVAKSTMTGTVERLKNAGLISINRDRLDRRAYRLKLTNEGKKLEPTLREVMEDLEESVCQELNPEEHSTLRKLLKRTIETMVESRV